MAKIIKKGILSTPYRTAHKAVSNPPAQYATLLHVPNDELISKAMLQWIAQQGYGKFGHYALGCDILLSGGLRISELISEPFVFVNSVGQIVFKGRKGSNDKLVTPLYSKAFWLGLRGWVANPCHIVSRFSWYRFLKSQGVIIHEKGKTNASVTHAARKLKAHELYLAELDEKTIQEVIGHKSQRSTSYYKPKV